MSRIRTLCALAFGCLFLAGCGVGETVAEAAKRRVPRAEWIDRSVGDCDVAATQHRWISQTGIWSSAASWDTAQIPGAGGASLDTAYFDGTSNVSVIGETPGGNTLFRIVTTPKYLGDIASPSNPLVVQIASEAVLLARCVFRGRGNHYYESPTGTFADVVIDTGTRDRVVSLTATPRNVFVHSGKVEFPSGAQNITSLNVLGPNAEASLPIDGMTLGDLRIQNGGYVTSNQSAWDRIEMSGGRLLQTGTMGDGCDVVMYGGQLTYATTAAISTHNPDMWLWGGALDLSSLKEDLTAGTLVIGRNATILGNLIGQGGEIGGTGLVIDLREDY